MWFHVGISRVVLSSSIFLRGLVVDAHSSAPPPCPSFLFSLPLSVPPSTTAAIFFHFLNVAICSVTQARLGWEAVWRFHRTWSCSRWCEVTGQRWGEFRDRVISYLGETSWSAGCSVGPRGAWDVSEEKPQRKNPEPVSFIKSDKLFLTIALFLLFYNAVIWNSASLFRNHKQVMNEPGDQRFYHTHMLDAPLQHTRAVKWYFVSHFCGKLNKCAGLIKIDPVISVLKTFHHAPDFPAGHLFSKLITAYSMHLSLTSA